MANKAGNSYTAGSTTDSVEIPTASPGFSTMASLNKVSPSDCDNDRQPEMAMWPPKPELLRMPIPTTNLVFDNIQLEESDLGRLRQRPTTRNGNINVWALILQLLVVNRCRNHLVNLISSSASSKIPNLALEFRHYLS